MLDDLDDFLEIIRQNLTAFGVREPVSVLRDRSETKREPVVAGDLFCPKCGEKRRVRIDPTDDALTRMSDYLREKSKLCAQTSSLPMLGAHATLSQEDYEEQLPEVLRRTLTPSMFLLRCVQCDAGFTALIHEGPSGTQLAVLPSVAGGLRTAHTPAGVAHYLDQAQRSRALGANSAAMAMYRGALEHLLFEQGFKSGPLGEKIKQLEKRCADKNAPKWALDLETEFLREIKNLGNGAIHPNDGDVSRQAALDNECLDQVAEVFMYLLFLAYEVPHESQSRLGRLGSKAKALKK